MHAQTTQELQAEIQQMKQQYEQKITSLETRIATLEQQNLAITNATQQNTVSVGELKAEAVATKEGETPSAKLTRDERTQIVQEENANTRVMT